MSIVMVISFATESSSLAIPLPNVIATDAAPTHWAFYFQRSYFSSSVSGSWSGSMCRAQIALQELQAVAIVLHRMGFYLSGKVVALHLDNITAKSYLSNQDGTVFPFLSRLACQILSLTDKHNITLIQTYIPTHLNVEADYMSWHQLLPEWHLLPQMAQAAFGVYQRWICWNPPIPLNASIITPWKHH